MPSDNTIHVAIELSASSWLIAIRLLGAEKSRLQRLEGGDTTALLALLAEVQSRDSTKLGRSMDIACCFEAGRDGFWLQRLLAAHGIAAHVPEPTSILVNRRARRAKTDRLDAEGMLRVLAAWLGGDRQVCSMVRVPTPEDEDSGGRTGNASPWYKKSHASRTALRRFCLPRAFGEGRLCARGGAI
jgi:transposase